MPKTTRKDNQTFAEKKALRNHALDLLAGRGVTQPVVLETHAGAGKLWAACYEHLPFGVAFEKNPQKTARLARQRPAWAVYEADCEQALAAGVGKLWTVDLLDVDPYGSCWETIDAFFSSARPFAPLMAVAVNCGLRQNLQLHTGWQVASMRGMVEKYGNDLYPVYLEVCQELIAEKTAQAGYAVERFGGYFCGKKQNMTHFLALLVKGNA